MLDIITQMADYICEHSSDKIYSSSIAFASFTALNNLSSEHFLGGKHKKIEDFKNEFTRAKELFDRGIDLETLRTVHNLGE